MLKKWQVISSQVAYHHPYLKVREDHVLLPSGYEVQDYSIWESGEVSQIIPVMEDGRLMMVRQYKHGVGEVIEEFPGGFIEPNDTPLGTAKKELAEETGFGAKEFKKLGVFMHHPSKETGHLHLFLASGLYGLDHKPSCDDTEEIEVVYHTVDELFALIERGVVMQTGGLVGLLLYLHQKGLYK